MATPYHRLARETPDHRWWRLPLAALVIGAAYLGLTLVLVVGAAVWFAVSDAGHDLGDWLDAAGELDLQRLDFFVLDMLGLVVLIPAVLLGVLATGPRPVGYLSSVTGRLRWRWLGRATVVATAVSVVTIGGSLLLTEVTDPADVAAPSAVDSHVVLALVAVLALVPFQAAAEEYVFRGLLTQGFGSIGTNLRVARVVAVVGPAVIFAAFHGAQSVPIFIDRFAFGIVAGVLAITTGGLEAGIAYHVVNNWLAFVLAVLFGDVSDAVSPQGGNGWDVVVSILKSFLLLGLTLLAARAMKIQTVAETTVLSPAHGRV